MPESHPLFRSGGSRTASTTVSTSAEPCVPARPQPYTSLNTQLLSDILEWCFRRAGLSSRIVFIVRRFSSSATRPESYFEIGTKRHPRTPAKLFPEVPSLVLVRIAGFYLRCWLPSLRSRTRLAADPGEYKILELISKTIVFVYC